MPDRQRGRAGRDRLAPLVMPERILRANSSAPNGIHGRSQVILVASKLLASASGGRLVGPMSGVHWVNKSSFTTGIAWSVLALNPVSGASASQAMLSEQADSELEQVVVTGSRIPIEIGSGTAPVTILELDDIRRGGLDTLGRVLQTLPFNAGSPTNTNSNFGDGSERIDLRGLGPKRTLILLNGRRFPNGGLGGDASVDASMVPLSLVDRVEVLTSGATAIYGADAVAGVVNVITREATSGLEIDLKNSLTERGDGNCLLGSGGCRHRNRSRHLVAGLRLP